MALLVQSRNPEWANFFFIYEHFGRFANEEHDRIGSLFFVPLVIVGLMPWTPALLKLLHRSGWVNAAAKPTRVQRCVPLFLTIWCVFIFLFFSASKSKLPLPAAHYTAAAAADADHAGRFRSFIPPPAAADRSRASGVVPDAIARELRQRCLYTRYGRCVLRCTSSVGASFFALAVFAAWQLNRRGRRFDAMLMVPCSPPLAAASRPAVTRHRRPAHRANNWYMTFAADPDLKADPFYSVGLFEQTLQPYLERTTILVDYLDELGLVLPPNRTRCVSISRISPTNGKRWNAAMRSPTSISSRALTCTALSTTWWRRTCVGHPGASRSALKRLPTAVARPIRRSWDNTGMTATAFAIAITSVLLNAAANCS